MAIWGPLAGFLFSSGFEIHVMTQKRWFQTNVDRDFLLSPQILEFLEECEIRELRWSR